MKIIHEEHPGSHPSFEHIETAYLQPESFDSKRISFILHKCKGGGDSYLDLGCNTGLLISLLSEQYNYIFGIEINGSALEKCNKKFKNSKKVTIIKGDLRNCVNLLGEKKFDLITCTDVLEHLPCSEVVAILTDIRTLLKESGRFIITTPGFFDYFSIHLGNNPNHLHAHSSYGWAGLCKKAGFRIIDIETMEFPLVNSEFLRKNVHFFGKCCLIICENNH